MLTKCTSQRSMTVFWIAFRRYAWKFVGLTQAFCRRGQEREREREAEELFHSLVITHDHLGLLIICIWVLGQRTCGNLGPIYMYYPRSLPCLLYFYKPPLLWVSFNKVKVSLGILHNLCTDFCPLRTVIIFEILMKNTYLRFSLSRFYTYYWYKVSHIKW